MFAMSGVRLQTVKNWEKEVDIVGEWLHYKETSGFVTRVHCELCSKYADRLKSLRNYSPSFALQGVFF